MKFQAFWERYLPTARYRVGSLDEVRTDCPFCGKAKHFYANIDTGLFICHAEGCGAKGNYLTFMREVGLVEAEAAKILRELGVWEGPACNL